MYEKEQYIQQNRELQNQVRLLREEQEALAVQLDQTGHVLDQANAEIRQREEELVGLQAILTGKEHEIEDLKAQRELTRLALGEEYNVCVFYLHSCGSGCGQGSTAHVGTGAGFGTVSPPPLPPCRVPLN